MGDPAKMTQSASTNLSVTRHGTADRNDGALASLPLAQESAQSIALDRLDSVSRAEVETFARILGASVHVVVPRGAPDPFFPRDAPRGWNAWRRQRDDRVFARAQEAGRGKSFYERLRETEEEEKRERVRRKEWLDRERRIARGWAKWAVWRAVATADAERFRIEHEDGRVDWLLELAARRAPLGSAPRVKRS